jgi:hypothetical protein
MPVAPASWSKAAAFPLHCSCSRSHEEGRTVPSVVPALLAAGIDRPYEPPTNRLRPGIGEAWMRAAMTGIAYGHTGMLAGVLFVSGMVGLILTRRQS